MSRFRDIELEWEGKKYPIPANRVFGAIATIEEHIFLAEFSGAQVGKLPLVKAARAWSALLEYAGCRGVDPERVYAGMFGEGQDRADVMMGFRLLELIMIPPEHLMAPEGQDNEGKAEPIAGASSKNASGRRSAKNGAPSRSSGRSRR